MLALLFGLTSGASTNSNGAFVFALCLVILVAGLPYGAFDYYLMSACYHGAKFLRSRRLHRLSGNNGAAVVVTAAGVFVQFSHLFRLSFW